MSRTRWLKGMLEKFEDERGQAIRTRLVQRLQCRRVRQPTSPASFLRAGMRALPWASQTWKPRQKASVLGHYARLRLCVASPVVRDGRIRWAPPLVGDAFIPGGNPRRGQAPALQDFRVCCSCTY